jgi:Protein of Unknown function (DUF2784)
MGYRIAADVLVAIHLAFILFATLGGLLALRWRWIVWVQMPAVAWAAWIEMSGRICPLTPWEVDFRKLAGESGYTGGFIEHYLIPVLYPEELTRTIQIGLGLFVLALNGIIYTWIIVRKGKR